MLIQMLRNYVTNTGYASREMQDWEGCQTNTCIGYSTCFFSRNRYLGLLWLRKLDGKCCQWKNGCGQVILVTNFSSLQPKSTPPAGIELYEIYSMQLQIEDYLQPLKRVYLVNGTKDVGRCDCRVDHLGCTGLEAWIHGYIGMKREVLVIGFSFTTIILPPFYSVVYKHDLILRRKKFQKSAEKKWSTTAPQAREPSSGSWVVQWIPKETWISYFVLFHDNFGIL